MSGETIIFYDALAFSHEGAVRVYQLATRGPRTPRIVVDLGTAVEATTSAFARLVLLRRLLLKDGRDLRLANLRLQTARLYEVIRLGAVLPRV